MSVPHRELCGPLRTLQLCVGELQENCYLAWREETSASEAGGGSPAEKKFGGAVVFDPGDEAGRILAELKKRRLSVEAFVQTHCHGDHIGALRELKSAFPHAPLYVPEAEREWLAKPLLNLSYFAGQSLTGPPPDHLVADGDELELLGLKFKAHHVPGHSPGGTAYFVVDSPVGRPHLFCGDILFQFSIGRSDLPGSAGEETLVAGIREKLLVLPDATIVHPGHGPETSIGEEKEFNPFCGLGKGGMA